MILSLTALLSAISQDILVLKNGEEIECKTEEINSDNIKYRKFQNSSGPLYTIDIFKVFMIKYENGTKDLFNYDDSNNKSLSNNQKDIQSDASDLSNFTDPRDGNTYKIVKIGEHIWMAENLRYDDGSDNWLYDNNPSNASSYGRLYNWESAMNVCPAGWHLSSDDEWVDLINLAGGDIGRGEYVESHLSPDGSFKKAKPIGDILRPTDSQLGFGALLGGKRRVNGKFSRIDEEGYWWTPLEYRDDWAYHRTIFSSGSTISGAIKKVAGLSVRCVKD